MAVTVIIPLKGVVIAPATTNYFLPLSCPAIINKDGPKKKYLPDARLIHESPRSLTSNPIDHLRQASLDW